MKNIFFASDLNEITVFLLDNNFLFSEEIKVLPYKYFFLDNQYTMIYRLYMNEDEIIINNLNSELSEVLKICLLTRNFNGYIRHNALNKLWKITYRKEYSFVIPYLIRLQAEYVAEIWEEIYYNFDWVNIDDYNSFVSQNELYVEAEMQRGLSYWDRFYRDKYKTAKKSPSYMYFRKIRGKK